MLKKRLAHLFYCEFCEILKNTFFTEQLHTTASIEVFWCFQGVQRESTERERQRERGRGRARERQRQRGRERAVALNRLV